MSTPQILLLGAIAGLRRSLSACRSGGCKACARTRAPGCRRSRRGSSSSSSGTCSRARSSRSSRRCDASNWGRFAWLSVLGIAGFVGRPDEPRLLRRVDEGARVAALVYAGRARRCRGRRVRAPRADRPHEPGEAARRSSSRSGSACTTSAKGSRSARRRPRARSSLAVTLIVGFGLHNATEGFGICGPLSGEGIVPSWRLPRPPRPDRRRADLPRHRGRTGVDERGHVGRVLHDRRRLDPLRRAGALGRQPQVRPSGARDVARRRRVLLGFATDFVVSAAGV